MKKSLFLFLLITLFPVLPGKPYTIFSPQSNPSYLMKGFNMFKNKDPSNSDFLFSHKNSRFRSLEPDEEWLKLERELKARNLHYDPDVMWLMEIAAFNHGQNSRWARDKIRIILESDRIMDMRTGDVFRPWVPKQLLADGNLHLLNQVDGLPWFIPIDALTRGMLITGPQGGGKSRFLIWLCKQLSAADPPIPFFILDPKLGLREWADYLNATYIDVADISIDLSPPPGLTYDIFLPSLMPQLGETIGVIYGVEILQDAAQICIELRNKAILNTGKPTEISLVDIYNAVPFVNDVSKGRRAGYREAVTTGLARILSGSGNLFKCRKGIDLSTLFNHNVILGCRNITDEFAAKFLSLFLLYWLYESERFSPPSDKIKRALLIDDATIFLAKKAGFDSAAATSSFTNIFSRLRSSGNAVITTTQIPHLADPGILALSHTILCIGPLHYGDDTKLLANMLSLSESQRLAITQLIRREAIGICACSAWQKVVHGFTVDVPNLRGI